MQVLNHLQEQKRLKQDATTISSLYQELKNGEWRKEAKSLLKITGKTAVKGGVNGLAAEFTIDVAQCSWKIENFYFNFDSIISNNTMSAITNIDSNIFASQSNEFINI